LFDRFFEQVEQVPGSTSLLIREQHSNQPISWKDRLSVKFSLVKSS